MALRTAQQHSVSDPDSGLAYPNPMNANIAKYFFANQWSQAISYVQDIAGGIAPPPRPRRTGTIPSCGR